MRPRSDLRRGADWAERLAAFVEERRFAPFQWGVHDCALFAADAVQMLVGVDPAADLRGSWDSEEAAEAVLAGLGGLEAAFAARLAAVGIPECSPRFASRGDIVLVEIGNEIAGGVVTGTRVAACGPDGLVFVPPRAIRRAWAV